MKNNSPRRIREGSSATEPGVDGPLLRLPQHQSIGQVVDVLARAGKVQKLGHGRQLRGEGNLGTEALT